MAIEIKKQEKSGFGIWLLIMVVVLAIGGWFLFQFMRPLKPIALPNLKDLLPSPSYEVSQVTFDIQPVLKHPVFQQLITHITWPPAGVTLGKENPFQPF